jgi:hypothetical protein
MKIQPTKTASRLYLRRPSHCGLTCSASRPGLNLVVCYLETLVGLFRAIFGSYIRRLDTEVQWYHHRPLEFDFHEGSPLTVNPEIFGLGFCCGSNAFDHAGCDLISVSELSWKPKQLCRNRRDVNGVIIFAECIKARHKSQLLQEWLEESENDNKSSSEIPIACFRGEAKCRAWLG